MVKICGCYALTQGVMYAIILFTSPAGAWELFAFSTIWAALFLYFGYTTKNSSWAGVEGVNATNEPIIVSGIMLVVHRYRRPKWLSLSYHTEWWYIPMRWGSEAPFAELQPEAFRAVCRSKTMFHDAG